MSAAAPSIADQVEVLNAGIAAQAPAAILQVFGEEQAGLDAGGVPAGVADPGTPMPDGDLLDVDGAPTSLEQARAGKPAVVIFYRGACARTATWR